VAVLRFTRDKRGYEHFYLVQPPHRRDKAPARVLYWFRSPPNVRVGREPFDPAIRRELEMQNPGVSFDWRRIVETPIPSAEAEKWRERRREERAAKLARRAPLQQAEPEPAVSEEEASIGDEASEELPVHVLEKAVEAAGSTGAPDIALETPPELLEAVDRPAGDTDVSAEPNTAETAAGGPAGSPSHRHRRRRRRRRGRHGPPGGAQGPSSAPGGDV
jgi:hypothetical protein